MTSASPAAPPFTEETALERVKFAQNAWNSRDPERIVKGYTTNCIWRNRDTFLQGHGEIVDFLRSKYEKELGYRLRKELFTFQGNKIAVQFFYEFHDETGQWYRAYGLEDWTFETEGGEKGKMKKRMSSINDMKIGPEERWFVDGVDVDDVAISERHL
ncbi:hypothetical protein M408DRAFT_329643 [Serendipita vermifera MAFF 305830]|uniref:DUF1348-domain-containing protein n=1 Tax=Serendipita vermifera MAFF 305830 TaxID=933852 RepID=A0A0C2WP17_SERVB|nr:hypothetical protein M408DRAFT_329643 [Serendipita vermifera MAFF 305830]